MSCYTHKMAIVLWSWWILWHHFTLCVGLFLTFQPPNPSASQLRRSSRRCKDFSIALFSRKQACGLYFLLLFLFFGNFCQSNYLEIYPTDLRLIFMIGEIMAVDDQSEIIKFSIPQGTLPWQPVFLGFCPQNWFSPRQWLVAQPGRLTSGFVYCWIVLKHLSLNLAVRWKVFVAEWESDARDAVVNCV